jgi:hypothetical protein
MFIPEPDFFYPSRIQGGQKGTVSRILIRNTNINTSAGGGSEAGRQDVRELPRVPPGRPLGAGADHRAPRAGNSRHQVTNPCIRPR